MKIYARTKHYFDGVCVKSDCIDCRINSNNVSISNTFFF